MTHPRFQRPRTMRELVEAAMLRFDVDSGRALDDALVRAFGKDRRVSHTILNAILSGSYHSEPKPTTLRTLADAARVPLEDAYAAAGLPYREPFHLPPSADELLGDQREAVIGVVRALVKANRRAETAAPSSYVIQEDDEEETAAYHSPEPAGLPEPEQP